MAGAEFIRCADFVGELAGYDFYPDGHPLAAADGGGYYRRDDAPPPDAREYSRLVLQRASAAGAEFVACAEDVMALPGYEHRDGSDGIGYYLLASPTLQPPPPQLSPGQVATSDGGAFDDFLSTMKELGAV